MLYLEKRDEGAGVGQNGVQGLYDNQTSGYCQGYLYQASQTQAKAGLIRVVLTLRVCKVMS